MKVSVMQANSTQQLPLSLHRVEVRAIRRQVVKDEMLGLLFPPLLVASSMMVPGIVSNQNHFPSQRVNHFKEPFHKFMEAPCVELLRFPHRDEQSVPHPYGAKVSHALAIGKMSKHRVLPEGTYVNLMAQYNPYHKAFDFPEISRRITGEEYRRVVDRAQGLGLSNLDIQGHRWLRR